MCMVTCGVISWAVCEFKCECDILRIHAYMDICGLILGICVFKCVYVYGGGGLVPGLLCKYTCVGAPVCRNGLEFLCMIVSLCA